MHQIAQTINVSQLIITFGYRKDIMNAFLDLLPNDFRWHLLSFYLSDDTAMQRYAKANLWPNGARRGLPDETRAVIFDHYGPLEKVSSPRRV